MSKYKVTIEQIDGEAKYTHPCVELDHEKLCKVIGVLSSKSIDDIKKECVKHTQEAIDFAFKMSGMRLGR